MSTSSTSEAGRTLLPPAATPGQSSALKTRRTRERGDIGMALIFIAPAAVGFLVFYLYPTIRGLYFSLTRYSLLGQPHYIGFANYQKIFHDPLFWNAIWVTLEYVIINIALQTVLAVGLAVLMHRLTKSTILRGTLLMPYLISNVIAALLWFWLLDYQIGLVNSFLDWIGASKIAFFGDSTWAIPTIAVVNTWRHMGYTALLVFAGLQTIPTYLYEAAAVDGSTEWRSFWRITLPLLRPAVLPSVVLSAILTFNTLNTAYLITAGGPFISAAKPGATELVMVYAFREAFQLFNFGYIAAFAVVIFVMLFGVTLGSLRFSGLVREEVH
jgi:multiple sugar transport system permease protein